MTEPFALLDRGLLVAPLVEQIRLNPWLWKLNDARQKEAPAQKQSQSILLRWNKDATDAESSQNTRECAPLPAMDFLLGSIMHLVAAAAHHQVGTAKLGRMMITKLAPGGKIDQHQDEGYYSDGYCRVHACLDCGGGNVFKVGGKQFEPAPGELWWFNHKLPHSVENRGDADRLHLIVDIDTPWLWERMGVYYQLESFFHVYDEAEPLLAEHWHEVARYKDIPLSPDMDMYRLLQYRGQLRCFTARDRGELIGYAAFFIHRHAHYDITAAQQDVLFISPSARRGRVGINLIKYAEQRLKAEGIDLITHHVKTTNGVQKVLERLGYEEVDRVLMKRLKE